MRESDLDLPIGGELRGSGKCQHPDLREAARNQSGTYIGNVSKPVHGFHRDASGNEGRSAIPPVLLGHDDLQPLSIDNVREAAGLHGVQGWDFMYPTFQLANLGHHRHDAAIRRAFLVDENELTAMNTELVRRRSRIVRRYVVRPVRIELEQGGHLVFWGRFWDIGELEDGDSLGWVDDLYDCSAVLSVRLPKDVVTWPYIGVRESNS